MSSTSVHLESVGHFGATISKVRVRGIFLIFHHWFDLLRNFALHSLCGDTYVLVFLSF